MKFECHTLIFILITILLIIPSTSTASCNRSCGNHQLKFPFGFSPGCQIQLNCTSNGTILASHFPVHSVTADTISVNLPAMCSRPVAALHPLFASNFAPTSRNAILLQNCGNQSSDCVIPTKMVETHFDLLDCHAANNASTCYSETDNRTSFIDYNNLKKSRCGTVFSAMSMESSPANSSLVSLDVQIVRLGWWLHGECRCSNNANCVRVSPPLDGKSQAYRCECVEGFAGDGFLDGEGCRKESLACNPSNYLSGRCGGTTRVGVLVGGLAAGASLMVSLGLALCFIRKRRKLGSRSKKRRQLCETMGITIPIYSYKEMEKATESFSEKRRLGNGAYGTVYSGKLKNQQDWVAIKRIKHRDAESNEQVMNEIKLLSSVTHPNLVRLLGCSIDNGEQILVYEFMPNGTLSQHLHRERGSGLPWPVRLAIAAQTAQAISYLHNAVNPPIFHRDIKSSNILVDYDFKSKVADFGLSRLGLTESSHVSTAPRGTPGYLDPQYHQHFHLSDKSDVYSFGVVLVEIMTALRVVDFGRPQNDVSLAALAVDRIGRGCLDEILDPFLQPTTHPSLHKVAELAFRCLAFHRDMRPSMMEVAVQLEAEQMSIFSSTTTSLDTIFPEDSWQSDHTSPSSNTLLNSLN